jgi:hypothetical protein
VRQYFQGSAVNSKATLMLSGQRTLRLVGGGESGRQALVSVDALLPVNYETNQISFLLDKQR